MSGEPRQQRRFERALRLTLELHELIEVGQCESDEAEKIREALDNHTGWSPDPHEDCLLTGEELRTLSNVSAALAAK